MKKSMKRIIKRVEQATNQELSFDEYNSWPGHYLFYCEEYIRVGWDDGGVTYEPAESTMEFSGEKEMREFLRA